MTNDEFWRIAITSFSIPVILGVREALTQRLGMRPLRWVSERIGLLIGRLFILTKRVWHGKYRA